MDIKRSGSQPSGKGPTEYFTSTVRIDPLFEAPDPARVVGASVTFEPGGPSAWLERDTSCSILSGSHLPAAESMYTSIDHPTILQYPQRITSPSSHGTVTEHAVARAPCSILWLCRGQEQSYQSSHASSLWLS